MTKRIDIYSLSILAKIEKAKCFTIPLDYANSRGTRNGTWFSYCIVNKQEFYHLNIHSWRNCPSSSFDNFLNKRSELHFITPTGSERRDNGTKDSSECIWRIERALLESMNRRKRIELQEGMIGCNKMEQTRNEFHTSFLTHNPDTRPTKSL